MAIYFYRSLIIINVSIYLLSEYFDSLEKQIFNESNEERSGYMQIANSIVEKLINKWNKYKYSQGSCPTSQLLRYFSPLGPLFPFIPPDLGQLLLLPLN